MKKYKIILLAVSTLLLVCSSIWSQAIMEVEGELTVDPANPAINVHNNFIENLADPRLAQDAATKAYVDNVVINYFLSLPNGIQTLLNAGETPLNIINAGGSLADFIGLNHAGGIIFYMDPSGNGTGLVAAPSDQSAGAEWGCFGTLITGADGTVIGTGNQNTIDIEAGCATSGIAADICANLSLDGFTDWFLPSKDELNEMYTKIGQGVPAPNTNIGNFAASCYWSSSEFDEDNAWGQLFSIGNQYIDDKDYNSQVRAIRAF
jgi:hypothetical protein